MLFQENEQNLLEEELEVFLKSMGYSLVNFNHFKQKKTLNFKIVIYSENGITVDDCTNVSKALARDFSLDDRFGESYTLEVSSPGIGRKLKTLREYKVFISKEIELFLKNAFNNKKKYKGKILKVEGGKIFIKLLNNENIVSFDISDISKARLLDKINFNN